MTIKEITKRASGAVIAATAVVAVVALSGLAPAAAATPTEGYWYYDLGHIADAQSDGWTGKGVTIAVLDSPVNTQVPTLADAGIEVREPSYCFGDNGEPAPATSTDLEGPDSAFHGTNVVSYIAGTGDGYPGQTGIRGVAPDATVLYYAVSRVGAVVDGGEETSCRDADGNPREAVALNEAMNDAMDAGADIITVSAGYPSGEFLDDAFPRAIREGVVVLGSMPNNDDLAVSINFPAGGNGAVGVQAADRDGTIQTSDGRVNDDERTTVVGPGIGVLAQGSRPADGLGVASWELQSLGNGTSIATPIVAGFMALGMQKWPDATGNQMIQSLIHTTGGEASEASYDPAMVIGYGFASATGMLATDPAQYPDENPLLTDDGMPTRADIFATPSSTPDPTAEPGDGETGLNVGVLIGILFGVLVFAAIVVAVIVLVVRRTQAKN